MERTKYNVDKDKTKRTFDGIVFDSIMEMRYYRDVLCPQVESGLVTGYELQKKYVLQPKFVHNGETVQAITYIADFYIEYHDGSSVVIDVKGCPNSIANLKKKMFWHQFPDIKYIWLCYSKIDGGWCEFEQVQKQRKIRRAEKQGKDKVEYKKECA